MDYDVFREQLAVSYPTYGHALWDPSPGGLYTSVEVGDVGFIFQGKFHRLFNVLLPGDHPSHENFGVPEHYEPLVPRMQRHIFTGTLSPNDFYSGRVTVLSGGLELLASGQELAHVKFSCSRKRGAILSLPVPAESQDTIARGDFARCIVKNIDVWFAFAQDLGLGISRMDDIILVTGRHLARSWTNVAFFGHEGVREVSIGVRVPNIFSVEWQFSRQDVRGLAYKCGPSGENLLQDQCIFVRGFRVRRYLGILPRLLGAAVPPGPGPGPGADEPISILADTDVK